MNLRSSHLLGAAALIASVFPLAIQAQTAGHSANAPGQQGAETTNAAYHDHLPSLRGIMPKPDEYFDSTSKHEKEWKRIPLIDGPGFVTDNGNVVLDVTGLELSDPEGLELELDAIPGVVECGIFARRRADVVLVGTAAGVRTLSGPRTP